MPFFNPNRPTIPREKKNHCEIIVERTSKGIRKRIKGDCSKDQLKALDGQNEAPSQE